MASILRKPPLKRIKTAVKQKVMSFLLGTIFALKEGWRDLSVRNLYWICVLVCLVSCQTGLSVGNLTFTNLGEDGGTSGNSNGNSSGDSSSAGSTNAKVLLPPKFSDIQSAISSSNSQGVVTGLSFASVTLPSCTNGDGGTLSFDVTYSMSGLPSWLCFDSSARQISLCSSSTVPSDATTSYETTYTCTASENSSLTAFRTANITDYDMDGLTDTHEYRFAVQPLVNPGGYFQLTPSDSSLFPSLESGIQKITSGLRFNDKADASVDHDGDGVSTKDEILAGTNPFIATSNASFTKSATNYELTHYNGGTHGSDFIIAADFNGDGNIDAAAMQSSGEFDCISYRFGNGNGTFGSENRRCLRGVNEGAVAVDVDKDGDFDIAVADLWNYDLVIVPNNGSGDLGEETAYDVGAEPYGLIAGDFSGDGYPDLVTANVNDTLSYLQNNGNGTFAAATSLTAGSRPFSLTAADLNQDRKLDLITANATEESDISILLGNGNGTFQSATQINLASGVIPRHVRVGDLDRDGDYDLAVSTFEHGLYILLNQGSGTFANPIQYTTGKGGQEMVIADFDGDGDLDIVVTDEDDDTLTILLGRGDGTFASRQTVATADQPIGIAAADFNNDGDFDLVVSYPSAIFQYFSNN